MSIRSYFTVKKRDVLDGELEKVVPASMAESVKAELQRTAGVKRTVDGEGGSTEKKRGAYEKIAPDNKAKIAKYAAENGITAAIRHFSKQQAFHNLKESTVRGWKKAYCEELGRRKAAEDRVPKKNVGRPLMLGQDVEESVKKIILCIRESGGVINNSIVIGIITGVLRDIDSNLLSENGGPIRVDKAVARRLLMRMQYVKRRGTTKAKVMPSDFQSLQTLFLDDIRTVVTFEQIPASLILNWDHTGLHYVPTSSWTLEAKGSQKVPITAIDDKRQLTAVFACSLAGDFLPPQVIYGGKTPACLPKASFPADWHVTYTPNHWANEETMMDYAHSILLPYVGEKRKEHKLSNDHPALAIFDQFKGQLTQTFQDFLAANHIIIIEVPPNCTDRLQPLDLSVNKPIKDSLRTKFQGWYAGNIAQQLKTQSAIKPADLRLSVMKPLGAKWLIEAVEDMKQRRDVIVNSFRNAGILDTVRDLL